MKNTIMVDGIVIITSFVTNGKDFKSLARNPNSFSRSLSPLRLTSSFKLIIISWTSWHSNKVIMQFSLIKIYPHKNISLKNVMEKLHLQVSNNTWLQHY